MKNKLGNCFEVSGKAALEVVSAISYSGIPYVVHAEVTGKGDLEGIKFAHAWVEDDYFVYDFSNGNHVIMLKGTYYELGKVEEKYPSKFRKYTFSEARKKMLETGHYGSWDISTKLELGGYVNAIKKDEIFNEIIDFKKYIKEILVKRFGFVVVEEDESGNALCQDSYKSHKIDFFINEKIDEKIIQNKKDQTQVIFISVNNEESGSPFIPKDDTIIHQQIFVGMGEKPVFNQIYMILETLIMSAKLEIEKKEALDGMQNLYRKGGNIGENSASISLNIPLFLRLMELAKEDIKDDKELHFIAERLEQIKSKGTLTMDDYDFLAGIQNHPKLVRFEKKNKGGLISQSNESKDIGFYQVTISHEDETEVLIETTDYNLAKKIYDDTKSHDKNVIYNSTKNLEICIRTFDFVGELDENESIDDYPIKDFYSDTDFYELADDGEWITLESEVIPSELNIEKETERIEKDSLKKNIVDFVKKMSVEYKYAGLGSKTFYSLVQHRNGYIIVRVADHFFNPDNIELGMEACWKGEKFGDVGEPEYRNVFGFLSISILDKNYKKGSFEKEYERKNTFGNYNELVQSIKIENLDTDFEGEIIDALFSVKEAIDSAIEDGYFEEGKKYSGIELEQGGSVLLAPNGKPSNLTAEQWHLVRTPEFKAWFGDWENDPENASKVVDENGEPLVVYHGSEGFYDGKNIELENQEITEFSSERLIFTTENIDVAKYFGDFKEYFVNIKNPFVIKEGYNVWSRIDEITLIKTLGEKTFIDLVNWEWREEYKNFSEWQKQAEESEPALISIDSLSTYLKQRKIYDGVIAFDIEETTNNISANDYIAFYPTQIKLADGTNTTFDNNNPDIRFESGGKILDQYTKQSINKVYVSIRIEREIKRKNQFGVDYLIDYFDTKPFEELSSGILNGVRGVSTSSYNISEWLVHRDCLVVMPFEKFVEHNQVEQVLYFDADYLTKNGLEPFFRLYDRKQNDDSAYHSILQSLFPKISNEFRIEALSKTNVGLLNYISEIFSPYNSSKFLSYVAVQPRIQSPEMFAEIVCEYINSGQSKIDYPYYTEYKNVQPEDIVSVLTKGIISSAKFYRHESEWLIKNQKLNIPEGSQLFFVISSYENMKDEYNKIIDAYGLRDKYKVYFISYKDLDRFQQMRWKRKDENFKKEINEFIGSVEKKISNALVDIKSEIVNEFERNVLHEIENTSYYNPEYFKDFDGNKLGNKYIKTPEVKNLYDNVLFKLSQTIESAIPKVVKDKNKYHLGQVYYEMARYFEELLNQSNNKQFEFFDEYGNKFYQDEFLRIMKYAFNDINFTKYEDSIKSRVGGDLYRAFSKDEIIFSKGGSTLLAPNGKPSNLTAEQWHLVRTPEFKAWFGDWENDPENASKVVDENGEPLVLHRGNLVNQEELSYIFNLGHDFLKKGSGNTFGFFFTNNIDIAKKYMLVDHFDEIRGGSITSVFIKSNKTLNLLDFDLKIGQDNFIDGLIKKGVSFDNKYKYLERKIRDFDTDSYKGWGYNVFDYFDVFTDLRNLFIKDGFDSVIFYEISRSYFKYKVYVAFEPSQIKLADGTNTTFSTENKDIRYGDGGEVEDLISKGIVELKMFDTTLEHAKEYGLNSKKPLYVQNLCVSENERLKGIGNKVMQYIDNYAIKNGHDVVFGHITQKARFSKDNRQTFFCDIDLIKHWLHSKGYAINSDNNDFHKIIQNNPDIRFEMGGILHGSPHSFPKEILAESPSGERVYLKGTNDSFPNVPSGYKIIQKFPFGRFRTENIGTGEGAQAFGWGLYFTDSEGIGRGYAKELAKNVEVEIDGKRVESPTLLGWISLLQEYYSGQKITKEDLSKRAIERAYEVGYITKSDYDLISNAKDVNVRSIKNLYKVSLHKGKTPDQYTWLEWDKAINRDTFQKIYDGIQKLVNPPIIVDWKIIEKGKGKDAYYELADILGSEKRASLFLLKNGIDGIKYPAESKTRGATSDTARAFNYVVFDENAVTIEEVEKFKHGGSVLLAPNGKQSNLTAEQWHLVRTPEFKAWFGDWENDPENASKVVDENGEPLLVYHGTLKGGFTTFNMGKFTENEWENIWGADYRSGSDPTAFLGSHFAKEKKIAEKFLTKIYSHQGDKPRLYECFLNIRKIKKIDEKRLQEELVSQNLYEHWALDREFEYSEEFYEMDSEQLYEKYKNDKTTRKKINENVLGQEHSDALSFADYMADEYRNKNKNSDGIEYINRIEGGVSYIAFKPNQIKLADGTNTTFNPNNPDIRFKHGGKIKPSKRRKRITKNRNNV